MSPALSRHEMSYEDTRVTAPEAGLQSNLARSVYCVLGIPIDAINMATVVHRIETAAADRAVFVISTPNLNFLVSSLSDPEFRESLLDSDLCPPDGAPIVWIAGLLGLPIKERAAGADLFDQLQVRAGGARRLTIFLFGGAKGVAAAAEFQWSRFLGAVSRGKKGTAMAATQPSSSNHTHPLPLGSCNQFSGGNHQESTSSGARVGFGVVVAHQGGALSLETLPGRRPCAAAFAVDPRSAAGGLDPVAAVRSEAPTPRFADQDQQRWPIDHDQPMGRGF